MDKQTLHTFQNLRALLNRPAPIQEHEWFPVATWAQGDKLMGRAHTYLPWRLYLDRLDEVCDTLGAHWDERIVPLHNGRGIGHSLTVTFNGHSLTRSNTGESDPQEDNATTSATSQAKKRTLTDLGCFRYLTGLPAPAVEVTKKKRFTTASLQHLSGVLGNELVRLNLFWDHALDAEIEPRLIAPVVNRLFRDDAEPGTWRAALDALKGPGKLTPLTP